MPRFVILQHDDPRGVHWDFMLETGDVLKTWSLSEPPASGKQVAAEALPDHRLHYLDYEGPISGGRGRVTRWDQGTYAIQEQSESQLVVELTGGRLAGRALLTRLSPQPDRWQVTLE